MFDVLFACCVSILECVLFTGINACSTNISGFIGEPIAGNQGEDVATAR